jgi:hypothetical protein
MTIKSVRPSISGDSLILGAQYFDGMALVNYILIAGTDNLTVLETVPIPAGLPVPDRTPVLHPDGRRLFWVQGFTGTVPDDIVFMYRLDTGQFEVILDEGNFGEMTAYQLLLVPGGRDLLVIGADEGGASEVSRVIRIDMMSNTPHILREFPAGISITSAAIRTVIESD